MRRASHKDSLQPLNSVFFFFSSPDIQSAPLNRHHTPSVPFPARRKRLVQRTDFGVWRLQQQRSSDRIVRCTWAHCDPTLTIWLHQRLRITPQSSPHPPTRARGSTVRSQRRRLCVYSWSDGGTPWLEDKFGMAHGPVF